MIQFYDEDLIIQSCQHNHQIQKVLRANRIQRFHQQQQIMQPQGKKPSMLTSTINLLQQISSTAVKDKDKIAICIKHLQDVLSKVNHIEQGNCNILDRDISQLQGVTQFIFNSGKKIADLHSKILDPTQNSRGKNTKNIQFWIKVTDIISWSQERKQQNDKIKKEQLKRETSKTLLIPNTDDKIKQLEHSNSILSIECSKLREQLSIQLQEINKYQAIIKQKDENLSKNNKLIEDKIAKKEDEKIREVNALNVIINKLKQQNTVLQQQKAKQQQSPNVKKLIEEDSDQKSTKQKKPKTSAQTQKQLNKTKSSVKDAGKNMDKQQKQYESKLASLKQIQKQLKDKTKQRDQANQIIKDINKHKKTKKVLQEQILKLQKQKGQNEKVKGDLIKETQKLSSEVTKLKDSYEVEIGELKSLIQYLTSESNIRKQYQSYRQELKQYHEKDEKIKIQSQTINSLNKRIQESVKQNKQLMAEKQLGKHRVKLLQLEYQLLQDQNKQLEVFVKEFHNRLQNKERTLSVKNQQNIAHYFDSQVLINQSEGLFLSKQLQKMYNKQVKAHLLFKYPLMKQCDVFQSIKNCPSVLIILKLETQNTMALYYEQPLNYIKKVSKGKAFIASISNQKAFYIKKKSEAIAVSLRQRSIVFGGGDAQLVLQDNPRLTISIGQQNKNSCFDTHPVAAQFFTGGSSDLAVLGYQIYQLSLK